MINFYRAWTPQGFRGYRFFAGPLREKLVSEISDDQLAWAINFNTKYILTHQDPQAYVKYNGRMTLVAMLPAGVASRRMDAAELALACCRAEKAHRAEGATPRTTVGRRRPAKPTHAPGELIQMARTQAAIQAAKRVEEYAHKAVDFGATAYAQGLLDVASSLRAAFKEEA